MCKVMCNTRRKLLSTLTLRVSISLSLSSLSPPSTRQQLNHSLFKTPSTPPSLTRARQWWHPSLSLFKAINASFLSLSLSSSVSFGLDFDTIIRRRRAQSEDEYDGLVGEGEGHEPILLPGPTKLSSSPAMQLFFGDWSWEFYPEKVFMLAEGREQWRHGQWDRPPKHVAVVFWLEFLIRTKGDDEREALKGFCVLMRERDLLPCTWERSLTLRVDRSFLMCVAHDLAHVSLFLSDICPYMRQLLLNPIGL